MRSVTGVCRSARREVKHLSTCRNRKQYTEISFWADALHRLTREHGALRHYAQEEVSCDTLSSGERNGYSPNRTCLHVRGCRAESAFSCEELPISYIEKQAGKLDPRR